MPNNTDILNIIISMLVSLVWAMGAMPEKGETIIYLGKLAG